MSSTMKLSKSVDTLALLGGPKAISKPHPAYNPYGTEEVLAAKEVIESGVLSKFIGAWGEDFYGGKKVQEFEKAWAAAFNVKHAISVNSATSGLICALGALDLEPGDEVICSPWTMSADGAAILVWNAIPVFADIELKTFNLDPTSIRRNLSPRTKAILVSDIFGQSAELDEIMKIAKERNIAVIEDAAQAPYAKDRGRFVGTIGDIGVFSLNYHKHIHTGEGGVCVTNSDRLAERMQLIRNHAESVVAKKGVDGLQNLIGFNFRLGEVEAAMGIEQLKKLPSLAQSKSRAGMKLIEGLQELPGLRVPVVKPECTNVFYIWAGILDEKILGVSRARIVEALRAEGVPAIAEGYQNIHLLPMFQQKIAYGKSHFPWSLNNRVTYEKGICPVAEELHEKSLIRVSPCSHRYSDDDVEEIVSAFKKVWSNLDKLKGNS